MKIRMMVEMASNSEEGIKALKEAVNEVRSGKFQRDLEFDNYNEVRLFHCKATVEILED